MHVCPCVYVYAGLHVCAGTLIYAYVPLYVWTREGNCDCFSSNIMHTLWHSIYQLFGSWIYWYISSCVSVCVCAHACLWTITYIKVEKSPFLTFCPSIMYFPGIELKPWNFMVSPSTHLGISLIYPWLFLHEFRRLNSGPHETSTLSTKVSSESYSGLLKLWINRRTSCSYQ